MILGQVFGLRWLLGSAVVGGRLDGDALDGRGVWNLVRFRLHDGHLLVGIDRVHAEVEIGRVLLVVLWPSMWFHLFARCEEISASAALYGVKANNNA